MLTRIFRGFHEHTIRKYCSESLDFLLKTKTQSHYFQNFCVTKFYRTSRIKQTFCIESTSMCIFVLRQDVSKLIENPVKPFQSSVTFLYLLKTSENQRLINCFIYNLKHVFACWVNKKLQNQKENKPFARLLYNLCQTKTLHISKKMKID